MYANRDSNLYAGPGAGGRKYLGRFHLNWPCSIFMSEILNMKFVTHACGLEIQKFDFRDPKIYF